MSFNIGVHKIHGTTLDTYKIAVATFSITDKANRVKFLEKTFLIVNVSPEIVLEILLSLFEWCRYWFLGSGTPVENLYHLRGRLDYQTVKGRLEPSQLITNHYYLEGNGILSVNGWNSGLVTCRSGIGGRQIVRWQTDQGDDANRRVNAQGQIQWRMHKSRYDGKRVRADTRVICIKAVWGTADREVYSERLILRSVKQLILFENQNLGLGW